MGALGTTVGLGGLFLADQYLEYSTAPFTITDGPYGAPRIGSSSAVLGGRWQGARFATFCASKPPHFPCTSKGSSRGPVVVQGKCGGLLAQNVVGCALHALVGCRAACTIMTLHAPCAAEVRHGRAQAVLSGGARRALCSLFTLSHCCSLFTFFVLCSRRHHVLCDHRLPRLPRAAGLAVAAGRHVQLPQVRAPRHRVCARVQRWVRGRAARVGLRPPHCCPRAGALRAGRTRRPSTSRALCCTGTLWTSCGLRCMVRLLLPWDGRSQRGSGMRARTSTHACTHARIRRYYLRRAAVSLLHRAPA